MGHLEEAFAELTDEGAPRRDRRVPRRYAAGESLDDLLPEAFAAVREAAKRTLGMRHFDVQLMGGGALHHGNIAEMKTGEGKTLVATLAAYLNAIPGDGVHVVTVNDYLASYQSELMGRVFPRARMTTGCILSGQTPEQRREQYAADITYGTNNEFGFDYLRDNMAWQASDMVQRGHKFANVDEVDSILIDEARTPLIISGPASGEANRWFGEFAKIANRLVEGSDYEVDEKKRTIGVLEPGIEKVEDHLGIDNLYESANTPLISFLNNAIKARALFKRDKDYVVMNGEVLIVDEHTGRILSGRRYNEGIHQAIEAKEGVEVKAENQTLATVTLQNYFRLYEKLSGMTGTAETEAAGVHVDLQARRRPHPDQPLDGPHRPVRPHLQERAVEVRAGRRGHREAPRAGAADPRRHHVGGEVRAAVEAAREARRQARGAQREEPRARGGDRRPGGSPRRRHRRDEHGRSRHGHHARRERRVPRPSRRCTTRASRRSRRPTSTSASGDAVYESVKAEVEGRGREGPRGRRPLRRRHRAPRVPAASTTSSAVVPAARATRARAGSISPSRTTSCASSTRVPRRCSCAARPTTSRSSRGWSRGAIRSAQSQVEARNAEIRKNVLKYDDVLNRQREAIYGDRRQILEGDDLFLRVQSFLDSVIGDVVTSHTSEGAPDAWTSTRSGRS